MNPRNIGLIMKKDLKGLGHERTILLAILLQLFIALFFILPDGRPDIDV